jgi:hypothetical protein
MKPDEVLNDIRRQLDATPDRVVLSREQADVLLSLPKLMSAAIADALLSLPKLMSAAIDEGIKEFIAELERLHKKGGRS